MRTYDIAEEISKYDSMIERLAREQSHNVVGNGSVEHARSLIRTMFRYASKSIDIFNGCMSEAVYAQQDIIDSAKAFLAKGGQLTVVIQSRMSIDEMGKHPFFSEAIKYMDCCTHGGCAGDSALRVFLGNEQVSRMNSHFLIMDDRGYRFEEDRAEPRAVASFNDTETAQKLKVLYRDIIKNSSPQNFTQRASYGSGVS